MDEDVQRCTLFVLDSRLKSSNGKGKDQYAFVRLYGRTDAGEAATIDMPAPAGSLSLRFVACPSCKEGREHCRQFDDALTRASYETAVLSRLTSWYNRCNKTPLAREKISFEWSQHALFYGLYLDPNNANDVQKFWTLTITVNNDLFLFRKLKARASSELNKPRPDLVDSTTIAEDPLDYDEFDNLDSDDTTDDVDIFSPLRPCETGDKLHDVAMYKLGIRHGAWCRFVWSNDTCLWRLDTDPSAAPLPTSLPNVKLCTFDIECDPLSKRADGSWNPCTNPRFHPIRTISLVFRSLHDESGEDVERVVLHTGPVDADSSTWKAHMAAAASDDYERNVLATGSLRVRRCETELEMLQEFASLVRSKYVDNLMGYNSDRFDLPYLLARINKLSGWADHRADESAAKLRRECLRWGRTDEGEYCAPPRNQTRRTEEDEEEMRKMIAASKPVLDPYRFDAPGMAIEDVFSYAKTLNLESGGKLDDVALIVLGKRKVDTSYAEMFDVFRTTDIASWAKVLLYNAVDSELALDIMLKKKRVEFGLQLSAVTGCTYSEICAGGQQKRLRSMVAFEIRERNMVFNEPAAIDFARRPWLYMGGVKVKGATVLPTKAGYYREPVVCTDFSSLYPSIIISRNLCPSRLLLDEVEAELSEVAIVPEELRAHVRGFAVEEQDADVEFTYHVLQYEQETGEEDAVANSSPSSPSLANQQGVLPSIAQKLLDARTNAKRKMKQCAPESADYVTFDAEQAAVKVVCNSLYGALNAIGMGSLYCRPLGATVTAQGRRAIATIKEYVEQNVPNSLIVGGDTDSVFTLLRGRTLAESEEEGTQIAAAVTDILRRDGAFAMLLAYEKTMLPALFVGKKMYAMMSDF